MGGGAYKDQARPWPYAWLPTAHPCKRVFQVQKDHPHVRPGVHIQTTEVHQVSAPPVSSQPDYLPLVCGWPEDTLHPQLKPGHLAAPPLETEGSGSHGC